MKTARKITSRSLLFSLSVILTAILLAGCADSKYSDGTPINPLSAYQPNSGSQNLPTNGQTQGVGKIDKPIVNVPYPSDGRQDHSNAPLLDNWHPGWQQSNCFGCHNDQSRIPDHNYSDTNLCYLCHGTNGLPGFGDATPPVIKGIVASPLGQSVTIAWVTDEPAISRLILRTKEGDRLEFPVSLEYTTNHRYTVEGLLKNTTYTYEIVAMDKSNNTATTATFGTLSFTTTEGTTTSGGSPTTPPSETFFGTITVKVLDPYTASATWTTKEQSRCTIYLENLDLGSQRTLDAGGPATSWNFQITGLLASTSYRLFIRAVEVSTGKTYDSSKKSFQTPKP